MFGITIEFDKKEMDDLIKNFSGALMKKAIRSAVDRTATWGKNYMAGVVGDHYKIKASEIKSAMTVKRTTMEKLTADIATKGIGLELIKYFNAYQDAQGIVATIAPDWIKKTPHAFINVPRMSKKIIKAPKRSRYLFTMGKGKQVIMMRVGKTRYPTTGKKGYGPPIPALLGRTRILEGLAPKLIDHLYKELTEQIEKRTGQQGQAIGIE